MINFAQLCEQNKSKFEEISDKLQLLCDKGLKEKIFLKFNSFFEKIFYLYCDDSKLFLENPP